VALYARLPVHGTGGARGFSTHAPFLQLIRFYGIQFYGFCVRAIQDSWFAVQCEDRIRHACVTDGQSALFAWNTARDPRAY
jgi:hypothetical protein